jgi:hypothetical protein
LTTCSISSSCIAFFPFAPSGSTAAVNDSRASRVLACSPPVGQPLCRFVVLRSKVCLRPFHLSSFRSRAGLQLRLSSFTPSGTFHPERAGTCQAHECGASAPLWYRPLTPAPRSPLPCASTMAPTMVPLGTSLAGWVTSGSGRNMPSGPDVVPAWGLAELGG